MRYTWAELSTSGQLQPGQKALEQLFSNCLVEAHQTCPPSLTLAPRERFIKVKAARSAIKVLQKPGPGYLNDPFKLQREDGH